MQLIQVANDVIDSEHFKNKLKKVFMFIGPMS